MNKKQHGIYWEVNPSEGDKRDGMYLGYGLPEPSGKYIYPLRTLELGETDKYFFESVRYFSKELIDTNS